MMTKGADSIMLPRCTIPKDEREVIEKYIYQFACSGLRTLVMAQKEVS